MFTTSLLLAALGATATSAACISRGISNGTNTTTTTTATTTGAVSCPVVLDGRVPSAFTLTEFDTANALFNPDYVKGNNVSWSDALLFPSSVATSRFDAAAGAYKSVEVTINNASIFQSQYGFRRAGLQFASDTNENSTGYVGVKTLHWSVQTDAARALNMSHEYLNVWHEAADYSADQIMFQTGTMIDQPDLAVNAWKLFDRDNTLLWSTPVESGVWQNFAITLDIDAK